MTKTCDVTFEVFQDVIECYGVAPVRWPDHMRAALQTFASENEAAAALIKEHQAFEKLLSEGAMEAGLTSHRRDALTDRIVDAALQSDHLKPGHAPQLSPSVFERSDRRARVRRAAPTPFLRNPSVLTASALAASLVLGVFAGWHGYASSVLSPITTAFGGALASDDGSVNTDPLFDLVELDGFGDEIL